MSSRIILGIDPGFGRTGYGLIVPGKLPETIDYGVIETPKTDEYVERLQTIHAGIENLINHYKPTAIGVEDLFFCKNITTAVKVGQARGVILLASARAKVPIFEISPTQVKQAISGYGHSGKREMQKMVQLILKLSKESFSKK